MSSTQPISQAPQKPGAGSPVAGSTAHRPRRGRDLMIALGLFTLMMAGMAGLAFATGWEETLAQLARLGLWQVAVLLVLSLVNYFFRGLRWSLFSRVLGLGLGVRAGLRHFLGGFAMSVTPGRIGELVRLRWIARESGWRAERVAPLVLVDRASDLAAMALILGLSVALSMGGAHFALPVAAAALLLAYVATRPRLLCAIISGLWRLIGRWPRFFARARTAAASLAGFYTARALVPGLTLGFLGWFAEGAAFWLLLTWFEAGIGLWAAVGIFTFATLAGGLTGAPGGVGGAEAAMVALLALEGVPPEISVPATLIIRLTTLWFALGIGLLVFPFAERTSMRAQNGLEN